MLKLRLAVNVPKVVKRSFGTNIPALQKATDPIQQLFLDKIREYKSKSAGGKLVDASPEILKERESELEKLQIIYGGDKGVDMTKFPQFQFVDPPVDAGVDKQ
ncbi:ATP synthase-coupling factor 6, mitochondrial [Harpegnathos saltator]|uniref:ATP synthase-coupling factor 6, mitochondrial n=1 Tax=Harpegnathos saltator TaxID=610380 RepID=UPI00058B17DC|nr:ATP synthase-coupling factor 6, mitochondrial [Harpegnathos saltator]XP_011154487.1 ATP synthase-coupling factor 6, mitochondrial [Harpegnathos saltator]XP_011154488.1 ATP synthase-coupling factor 6, mitochondrial [Harpegnathos saltator]